MDKVYIKGLQLYTLIGVYDFERLAKQRVIIDIELQTSLQRAGQTDNVEDTLDYGKIAARLADIAQSSSYKLLEALGEHMANMLLDEFAATSVCLTINKPDILNNVTAVGIHIVRNKNMNQLIGKHEILISVGSNIEKEINTTLGLQAMHKSFDKLVLSTVFESESVGFNGDNFFNLVVHAYTALSIEGVCARLKAIEDSQGRTRDIKFGNRTLDLDLLTYDDVITDTPIILPRGEIEYNAFVLKPMAEIVPHHIHPTTGESYLSLYDKFMSHSKNKHQRLWPSGFVYKG